MARGYRAKIGSDAADELGIGLHADTLLVIKLPDSRALRVVSRSLFLAMFVLALPSLVSVLTCSLNTPVYDDPGFEFDIDDGFEILLRDLVDEGLIKKGQKGFVLSPKFHGTRDGFELLKVSDIDLAINDGIGRNNNAFDFVVLASLHQIKMIDGAIKAGCLVISPLGYDPSDELRLLRDFKIVYLRRFKSTVVAMRKVTASPSSCNSKPALCGVTSKEMKAALKGLEDAYLEPPRHSTSAKKSSFTSRKIKFLPDLLKDSLVEYPRRVFISDELRALDWFYNNYPMRGQEFEVFDMVFGSKSVGSLQEADFSSWLTKNVRCEDYVVLKAEAQVVEEMLRDKTLCLVDELFMECENQWQEGNGDNVRKRAYWQCLDLYGKVRDEGIAVHQWWR